MVIENNTQHSLHLPEVIIGEILSRLAGKPLLRFRCVSKPWRSLISSKHFIEKHLQNSKTNKAFAHHMVLLCSSEEELSQCSLLSLFKKPDIHALESNFATNIRIDSINIVGSCNGLVCIVFNMNQFVLWNPLTRISKKLPEIDNKPHYKLLCYGFGCDESSGDYKVVALVDYNDDEKAFAAHIWDAICQVYCSKTDSWKEIESPVGLSLCSPKQGRLASGKLHWNAFHMSYLKNTSVAFDLKKEVFEKVKQDSFKKEKDCYKKTLLVDIHEYTRATARTSPSFAELRVDPQGDSLMNIKKLEINESKFREPSKYDCEIYVESLVSPEPSHQQ